MPTSLSCDFKEVQKEKFDEAADALIERQESFINIDEEAIIYPLILHLYKMRGIIGKLIMMYGKVIEVYSVAKDTMDMMYHYN